MYGIPQMNISKKKGHGSKKKRQSLHNNMCAIAYNLDIWAIKKTDRQTFYARF